MDPLSVDQRFDLVLSGSRSSLKVSTLDDETMCYLPFCNYLAANPLPNRMPSGSGSGPRPFL